MPSIKDINQNIFEAEGLKTLASAYSEISSIKLGKIRHQIEKNDLFTTELAQLFKLVQEESLKRQLFNSQKKGVSSVLAGWKKPGIVSILLTSNSKFYGGLETSIIRYFMAGTERLASQYPTIPHIRVIVGKTGVSYLQGIGYNLPYQPFTFKHDLPTEPEASDVINKFRSYQTVLVFHSKFKTVAKQIPVVTDISQTPPLPKVSKQKPSFHIFEPEINQIMEFFSTQIMKILLQQTFLEAELSRTAYRLISMDQAQDNANKYIKTQTNRLVVAKRATDNLRLLETIISFKNWGKKSYD